MNPILKIKYFSFFPIILSLILLVTSMIMLIANEESYSKSLAVYAFLALIVGIIWQFINHLNKDTLSQNESPIEK